MKKRQTHLLKQISESAIKLDWEKAFFGKAKGNQHLMRVNKIAKYLQSKEGGNEFIVLAAAWIHDVSLAWGADTDSKHIDKHTRKYLKGFDLENDEFNQILNCALKHETGGAMDIEAKIVHDADVIDKSGMLGVIRHIWKMTNMLELRVLNTIADLKKLHKHLKNREKKVHTTTGKKIVNKLNKELDLFFKDTKFALESMKEISTLSQEGIISDTIAKQLIKDKKHPSIKSLKNQLDLSYLN